MELVPAAVANGILGVVFLLVLNMIRQGTLLRNRVMGIRTKHSLMSDEPWQLCHNKAAPYILCTARVAFSFVIVLATMGYLSPPEQWFGFLAVVPTVTVALIAGIGAVFGHNAARDLNMSQQVDK